MIIEEIISKELVKHYSDQNLKIIQMETGIEYDSAIDAIPCRYTYIESSTPIEIFEEDDWEDNEE